MRLEIEADDLKTALDLVNLAASRDIIAKKAGGIARVRVQEFGPLLVEGYGQHLGVAAEIVAESSEGEGYFNLPIKPLLALCSDPPAPILKIDATKPGKVGLKCGTYKSTLQTPPATNWSIPVFEQQIVSKITVSTFTLRGLLTRIQDAIFTESELVNAARRVLEGALFVAAEDVLTVYSTDNNRLSKASIPCSGTGRFAVDKSTVLGMLKLLQKAAGTATLEIGHSGVVLRTETTLLGSQVLDLTGTPNLDALFAKKHTNLYDFPSRALARAVKRVQVMAEASAVHVSIGEESCEISASTTKAGEASDQFDLHSGDADTVTFKILAKYLSDATRGAEDIRLHADDVPQQILIEHIDCEFSTKHVLGAMR